MPASPLLWCISGVRSLSRAVAVLVSRHAYIAVPGHRPETLPAIAYNGGTLTPCESFGAGKLGLSVASNAISVSQHLRPVLAERPVQRLRDGFRLGHIP
jgi:hypothetical protein